MKDHRLYSFQLALWNLKHGITRTIGLVILAAMLSAVLFGGSMLTFCLQNGLKNMKERLGADVMIVPVENQTDMEAILLKGEPSCFYFKKTLEDKVQSLEGVEKCTSQFFLTSLDAECCDTRVQLIGFDPATDFSVQPWIQKAYGGRLSDGAVIVGSEVRVEQGRGLKLYDVEYDVAAKLDQTGTGLDRAVFATQDTIKKMYGEAYAKGQRFLEEADPDNYISSILIRVEEGYDVKELVRNIRKQLGGVQVVESQSMITGTADNIKQIAVFLYLFAVLFLGVAIIALGLAFILSANERKREFAILRTLGATRKKLAGIILWEAVLTSLAGGVLGIAAASVLVFPFHVYLGDKLGMPYVLPSLAAILATGVVTILVAVLIGPLAAGAAALKISRAETYLIMREGN